MAACTTPTPALQICLNQPMSKIREQLSQCPVKTRLSLTGTLVVARDIAHAKLQVEAWAWAWACMCVWRCARACLHKDACGDVWCMRTSTI